MSFFRIKPKKNFEIFYDLLLRVKIKYKTCDSFTHKTQMRVYIIVLAVLFYCVSFS